MKKKKNKKRGSTIKHILGSAVLLLIAGGIGVGVGLYETNGIKKYVMEAHDYYKDNNWVALYNYAQMEDDDFINEYFFEEMSKKKYGYVNGETLELDKIQKGEEMAEVSMYYSDSLGDKIKCDFVMEKLPQKNYYFFNEWKLNIDNTIVEDCKIQAPADFKIYLDGIELDETNAAITNGDMVEYKISRLFSGEHIIFAERDMLEPQEMVVNWDSDNGTYVVDTSTFKLVDAITTGMEKNSQSIIKLMYKNVFEETGLEGLDAYMYADETTKEEFNGVYDGILSAIQPDDGSTLNSLSLKGFDNFTFSYIYPNKVAVSIDYSCSFKARGPRNVANGAREKYEGEATSTVTMEYLFDGENWVCCKLNMECIDYSKKED